MFEYLLDVDRFTGEIVPMLAESWERSGDSREWTFQLRRGVQFHFAWGEFTAGDVVHSMSLLRQGTSQAGSADFWRSALDNLRVNGSHSITFVLNRSVPKLARLVSAEFDLMLLSQARWEADGEAGAQKQPAGTGPYRFLNHRPEDSMRFERVENHWRQTPQFSELLIAFMPNPKTRATAFLPGRVQVHIAQVPKSALPDASIDELKLLRSQLSDSEVLVNPDVVSAYAFPGTILDEITHLEYIEARPLN